MAMQRTKNNPAKIAVRELKYSVSCVQEDYLHLQDSPIALKYRRLYQTGSVSVTEQDTNNNKMNTNTPKRIAIITLLKAIILVDDTSKIRSFQ